MCIYRYTYIYIYMGPKHLYSIMYRFCMSVPSYDLGKHLPHNSS